MRFHAIPFDSSRPSKCTIERDMQESEISEARMDVCLARELIRLAYRSEAESSSDSVYWRPKRMKEARRG